MDLYFNLFIRAAFVENLALTFFLGMCTFLAISKRVDTALGLGLAVMVIQTITVPVNYLIYTYLLKGGALAWAGLAYGYGELGHSPFPVKGAYPRARAAASSKAGARSARWS